MLPFSRFNRYFQEVARQASLRKAAEVLHVPALAIDRQIIRAEQALGIKLFERLLAGLKLTAAGELMLDDVHRWQKEYARTVERVDEIRGSRRGHVGVALANAPSEGITPLSDGITPQTIATITKEELEPDPVTCNDVKMMRSLVRSGVGVAAPQWQLSRAALLVIERLVATLEAMRGRVACQPRATGLSGKMGESV